MTIACNAAQVSPRAGKRLVNVFKLLKIIWHYRGQETDGRVQFAMVLLLALSAQHPEVMRGLLKKLEQVFHGGDIDMTLQSFLIQCLEVRPGSIPDSEWEKVSSVIAGKAYLGEKPSLAEIGRQNIRMVASYSFVGEIGWDAIHLDN